MKKYILPAVTVLLLSGGCFFSRGSALKVAHYQPELPVSGTPVCSLRTGAVSNISGAGREFVVRDSGSAVKIVPGKRWFNSPEVMLKSAMLMNFSGGGDADAVSAQIIRFEFSPGFKTLDAVIVFTLKSGRSVICRESEPVENENYGDAVSKILLRSINQVIKAVKK